MIHGAGFFFLLGVFAIAPFIHKPQKYKGLISKFVVDREGNRIGETISFDGDLVIIKQQGTYLAVPLKHIEVSKDNVRVRGIVEWDNALQMGELWKKKFK